MIFWRHLFFLLSSLPIELIFCPRHNFYFHLLISFFLGSRYLICKLFHHIIYLLNSHKVIIYLICVYSNNHLAPSFLFITHQFSLVMRDPSIATDHEVTMAQLENYFSSQLPSLWHYYSFVRSKIFNTP